MTISGGSWPAPRAGSPSEKAERAQLETKSSARGLEPQERLDWLRLSRSEGVGPITFYALLRRFGSAAAALDALPRLSRPAAAMSRRDAERELAAIERLDGHLVCWGEPLYPSALAAVEDAPPVLTVIGRVELTLAPMVAVVGARNASANGRRFARDLAAELGESGIVVVSGLARGIDAAAHLGALDKGSVAIVAGGVDIVYPEENRALHEALARDGAILAEMPLGTEPQARHFPRRNRIISGIALGIVVVEAAAKSGSLITARYALEQGREVFAVPGSPLDPRSRGANDLLRRGATLTETAEDVLAQLGPLVREPPPRPVPLPAANEVRWGLDGGVGGSSPPADDEDALAMILERLGPTPVAIDELVRQCQLTASAVATLLLELELAGRVERHPGNLVSLR